MRKILYYYILFATIIYLLVGAFVLFIISGWIGEKYYKKMGENALNLATVAANGIDITNEQIRELEEITFDELLQNENNLELSNLFKSTSLNNIKYAYVIRKVDESAIKYHVTTLDKEFYGMSIGTPLDWIWLMDVIVNQKERKAAENDPEYYTDKNRYTHISGETQDLYKKQEKGYFVNNDEWGSQISGMVPIYTVEGQYIGLLGVDVYSDDFYTYRNKVIVVLFLLLFIPTIILLLIFLKFHFRYRKEMKSIVFQDKLTGLYTRIYYENIAKQLIKKLKRTEDSLTVIMLDIDEFKAYNDYYGHVEGDEIIKQIGLIFRNEIELSYGCAGRYGGEEFIAFIPNLNVEEGNTLCENIRSKVENYKFTHESREDIKIVTVSLGIYTSTIKDKPIALDKLIDKADKALYIAKKEGRNCFIRVTN